MRYIAALLLLIVSARAWDPPIGIPEPAWPTIGNPIEATAPVPPDSTPPAGWTGQVAGRYYVSPGAGNDTGNAYGYPGNPRNTLPASPDAGYVVYTDVWDWNIPGYYYVEGGGASTNYGYPGNARYNLPVPLPANSKVFMAGTVVWGQTPPNAILSQGTATEPVWITNYNPASPATLTASYAIAQQSTYLIFEGIQWDFTSVSAAGSVTIAGGPNHPVSYVCMRNCSVLGKGDEVSTSTGSNLNNNGIVVTNYASSWDDPTEQVVIYNCTVNKVGNWMVSADTNGSCVLVLERSQDVWVVDSTLSYAPSAAVGVGAGITTTLDADITRRVYVGRNTGHHTGQNTYQTKRVKDAVISQNTAYMARRDSPGTPDAGGLGLQYGPIDVWVLYNRFCESQCGIQIVGGSDDTQPGVSNGNVYIIGNVFSDIHDEYGTAGPWLENGDQVGGVAVAIRQGHGTHYVVNNTFYDYDCAVNCGSLDRNRHVEGNIFALRNTLVSGFDVQFMSDPSAANMLRYNVFPDGGAVLQINEDAYTGVTAINAIGALKSGNVQASVSSTLTNAWSADFTLKAGATAIGLIGSSAPSVYGVFSTAYSRSIAYDFSGSARPQDTNWDAGAYEYGGGGGSTINATTVNAGTLIVP